jgi:hypothetical protein
VPEVELPNPAELAEQREKAFHRGAALSTAVYAVVLAIAALGGNYAMKEMLLAQQQASDQWAFYQAKVIREHLYRVQKLTLEAALSASGGSRGSERGKLEALARKFAEEEARYGAEKKDVEKAAQALEHERDFHRTRDPYFDYAEVLLQIAIVCASVAILADWQPIFWFSIALAALGALLTLNGFLLFFRLPFLHGH